MSERKFSTIINIWWRAFWIFWVASFPWAADWINYLLSHWILIDFNGDRFCQSIFKTLRNAKGMNTSHVHPTHQLVLNFTSLLRVFALLSLKKIRSKKKWKKKFTSSLSLILSCLPFCTPFFLFSFINAYFLGDEIWGNGHWLISYEVHFALDTVLNAWNQC